MGKTTIEMKEKEREREEHEQVFEGKWYAHSPMRNALIAGLLTGMAFAFSHLGVVSSQIETAIYVAAILLGGYHWMREGIECLVAEREVGIEILMFAATIGSAALGMWDEAAVLVVLYSSAEGLEEYTYARTRASIRKLLDLAPKEARLLRDGNETTIPAEDLKVGDLFLVKPGEAIPTDGIIEQGQSSLDEAPVTGESIPVEKSAGMPVFAATLNQQGSLVVRATATFADNTLSKIIHLVEEAQVQKSTVQLFIDRFGARYTPAVLAAALLVGLIPPLLGFDLGEWATRAVVLLVAAAPCALVMSTPVAIAAGIGLAGRHGVLIKGGVHLESLGRIRVVAFDKTGTLTRGKPVVTDVVAFKGDQQDILRQAYGLERLSEHPLAQAIVEKAKKSGLTEETAATDFQAVPGAGVKGRVRNRTLYLGKPEILEGLGLNCRNDPEIDRLRQEGKTVVCLGVEQGLEGVIALRDEVRPQAKSMAEMLHRMGVKVVMLTGDNEVTARAIGRELEIDDFRANLKPEDKIEAIKELKRRYRAVAMVGDGINDAPALAEATVGIAMGTAGTDAAIEAADTALMGDDLSKLPFALHLGKRARTISNQNIVFSLVLLAALIPSALLGVMSVAIAVLLHEASELLAVANGLRVAHVKSKG